MMETHIWTHLAGRPLSLMPVLLMQQDPDSSGLVQEEAGHGGSPLEALVLVDSIDHTTDALIVHSHVSPTG